MEPLLECISLWNRTDFGHSFSLESFPFDSSFWNRKCHRNLYFSTSRFTYPPEYGGSLFLIHCVIVQKGFSSLSSMNSLYSNPFLASRLRKQEVVGCRSSFVCTARGPLTLSFRLPFSASGTLPSRSPFTCFSESLDFLPTTFSFDSSPTMTCVSPVTYVSKSFLTLMPPPLPYFNALHYFLRRVPPLSTSRVSYFARYLIRSFPKSLSLQQTLFHSLHNIHNTYTLQRHDFLDIRIFICPQLFKKTYFCIPEPSAWWF